MTIAPRNSGLSRGRAAGLLAGLLSGLFSALLAGCARDGAVKPASTVVIAHETPVLSLDPTFDDAATYSALSNVFEPLVDYDRQLQVVPSLASVWRNPDETTWEFDLREGATFHDGTAVRAPDVAAALERARRDPASRVAAAFWSVESVEAAGAQRVRIRTSRPDALLLHQMTQVLIARGGTREEIERTPVGTGPYRVVRWEKGGTLELAAARPEALPDAAPRGVRFVTPPGPDATIRALSSGEVDVAAVPPATVLLRPKPVFRILSEDGLTMQILWIDTRRQPGRTNPFADVRVRRAVVLALDRAEIARQAVGHATFAAEQAVPRAVFGHDPSLDPIPFDPAAARRLLAEAGFGRGFSATLHHRDDAPTALVARAVAGMLSSVGIRLQPSPLPWEELLRRQSAGDLPLYLMGWVFDSGDAASFFRDTLAARSAGLGRANAGFESPLADQLFDQAASTFEAPLRQALLQRLDRLAQEEVPFVPLYRQPETWGVGPRVSWQPRPDGRLLAIEMALGSGRPAK